jgi:hypothetical protein
MKEHSSPNLPEQSWLEYARGSYSMSFSILVGRRFLPRRSLP